MPYALCLFSRDKIYGIGIEKLSTRKLFRIQANQGHSIVRG